MTDVPLSATLGPVFMMDPRLGSTIGYYSSVYGIPTALLETTLVVEAIDDQSPLSTLIDSMNKAALDMLETPPQYGGLQARSSAAAWLAFADWAERRHGSLGIGGDNYHIDTARDVENHFQARYPGSAMSKFVPPGKTQEDVLRELFSPQGNIKYAAALLRMLSDQRTGTYADHTDAFSVTDMAVIYGAYRGGFKPYGGEDRYRAAQQPSDPGQIFLNYWRGY